MRGSQLIFAVSTRNKGSTRVEWAGHTLPAHRHSYLCGAAVRIMKDYGLQSLPGLLLGEVQVSFAPAETYAL
jgi:hypothetical protein